SRGAARSGPRPRPAQHRAGRTPSPEPGRPPRATEAGATSTKYIWIYPLGLCRRLPIRADPRSRCLLRPRRREAEEPRGIEAEHLRTRPVAETAHRPLDRLGRMRPRALVMRVVVAPHDVVDDVVTLGEIEPRLVLLQRREAVLADVLARHHSELRPHP